MAFLGRLGTGHHSLEPFPGYSFSIPIRQASSNFRKCEISAIRKRVEESPLHLAHRQVDG